MEGWREACLGGTTSLPGLDFGALLLRMQHVRGVRRQKWEAQAVAMDTASHRQDRWTIHCTTGRINPMILERKEAVLRLADRWRGANAIRQQDRFCPT